VLPIGGVKNKVLAAVRAGITTVMLPERNKKDYEDVPEAARENVKFVWMSTVDDAIEAALEPATAASHTATTDLTDEDRRTASG
jgi:ATP-dependent Lon protease